MFKNKVVGFMIFTLRLLAILLPIFYCNLYSCFCVRNTDECDSIIRPIVRRMQTDLTQNKLNYEISSNFAVRMSRADYNGCLSTIKLCMFREIARIYYESTDTKEDSDDDTEYFLLGSIKVMISSKCRKRLKSITDLSNWDQLDLPKLSRLPKIPENDDPELIALRRTIEYVLLKKIVMVIG